VLKYTTFRAVFQRLIRWHLTCEPFR